MSSTRALNELMLEADEPDFNPADGVSRGTEAIPSAQIENLVSMVFFKDERPLNGGRVIGITAPVSGEGVTTIGRLIAAELAAMDRFRSLLVTTRELEALQVEDLEKFESLWSENKARGFWQRTSFKRNSEVPKGLWSTDPRFRAQVINTLRQDFDNIVIDCRPVSNSGDISLISTLIDGFILVVRSGGSTQLQVQQAIKRVQLASGVIRGCCFNRRKYPIPAALYRFLQR